MVTWSLLLGFFPFFFLMLLRAHAREEIFVEESPWNICSEGSFLGSLLGGGWLGFESSFYLFIVVEFCVVSAVSPFDQKVTLWS